jgi:hypothetical protein
MQLTVHVGLRQPIQAVFAVSEQGARQTKLPLHRRQSPPTAHSSPSHHTTPPPSIIPRHRSGQNTQNPPQSTILMSGEERKSSSAEEGEAVEVEGESVEGGEEEAEEAALPMDAASARRARRMSATVRGLTGDKYRSSQARGLSSAEDPRATTVGVVGALIRWRVGAAPRGRWGGREEGGCVQVCIRRRATRSYWRAGAWAGRGTRGGVGEGFWRRGRATECAGVCRWRMRRRSDG